MPPCLTLSIIRYGWRVKWVNPEKGVAPSPTPSVVAIEKGAFRSFLTTVANFTYLWKSEQETIVNVIYTNSNVITIGSWMVYLAVKCIVRGLKGLSVRKLIVKNSSTSEWIVSWTYQGNVPLK